MKKYERILISIIRELQAEKIRLEGDANKLSEDGDKVGGIQQFGAAVGIERAIRIVEDHATGKI